MDSQKKFTYDEPPRRISNQRRKSSSSKKGPDRYLAQNLTNSTNLTNLMHSALTVSEAIYITNLKITHPMTTMLTMIIPIRYSASLFPFPSPPLTLSTPKKPTQVSHNHSNPFHQKHDHHEQQLSTNLMHSTLLFLLSHNLYINIPHSLNTAHPSHTHAHTHHILRIIIHTLQRISPLSSLSSSLSPPPQPLTLLSQICLFPFAHSHNYAIARYAQTPKAETPRYQKQEN